MTHLEEIGYCAFFAAQLELLDRPEWFPARLAADARDAFPILDPDPAWATLSGRLQHSIRAGAAEPPIVGDWLAVSREGDKAVIHHVFDRRTCLRRRAAGSSVRAQVLAANVDVYFVVTAAGHDLNPRRVERYLAAVWDSGASPVVVINKTDLVESAEDLVVSLSTVTLAVPVIGTSAREGKGTELLRAHLKPGITAAFIGSSGVGKSTLVNQLYDQQRQATGELDSVGRGRHTTSRRELMPLPGGGLLLDTPGLRELGLVDSGEGLDAAFAEISELSAGCRYTDCTHTREPGCAVRAAVGTGALSEARLASYHRLRAEAEAAEARRGGARAGNTKKRWKAIHKSVKSLYERSDKYK